MERREAIRATYQTFDGRVSEYALHPYHLLAYHGNWYVLARNVGKDQIETFALSRFRRIETTGQTFTRPADFNAETYAKQAFGIVGGEEPIRVRLLFEATASIRSLISSKPMGRNPLASTPTSRLFRNGPRFPWLWP